MKSIIATCAAAGLAVFLLGATSSAQNSATGHSTSEARSPSEAGSESSDPGIPLEQIIASVAHQTGKRYLVDPSVQARVHLVGQDVSNITYSDLLTILQLHGFAATEGGGYVRVVPNAAIRQMALPQMSSGQTYPDAQFVNYVIPVKNGPAAFLVPILRPMMPQVAQLVAAYCSNSLLIVDSFDNVKRIEAIVKILDVGTPYKPEKCTLPNPGTHHEPPPKRNDS
jgi:type II secretory pathway component GspD/PulD (secretin)